MTRRTLSDKGVAALKPRAERYAFPDPELRGHYIRVQPTGGKSYVVVTRTPAGKQAWVTIGPADLMTIEAAREKAREVIKRVRDGLPPVEPTAQRETFREVADNWLKRHVTAKGLRSHYEVKRLLEAHVLPEWGERGFLSIRRSDVAALLDDIEDDHGARQADYVLAIVRGIMNWFAARNDDYVPPIVRGMRRTVAKERARSRVLSNDEIRIVWMAAKHGGIFGRIVRLLLLTAQRREKVAGMKWSDIRGNVWTIPAESREKGNAGELVLPELAMDVIAEQARLGENPFVFAAARGNGHVNGWSKAKLEFDAELKHVAPWVLHDLRRTARSLMARAGVSSDIAERVMGHAIEGVEGVYDRHKYRSEKADALQRLALLIDGVVNPRKNVVRLPQKQRKHVS